MSQIEFPSPGVFARLGIKPVINASRKIAEDVVDLLDEVVIPIFPRHTDLGTLSAAIDEELYDH